MSAPPKVFKDLLRRLLPDRTHPSRRAPFASQAALAAALHVEANTVSRILNAKDDVPMDNEGCLRLAIIGGYPLTLVFTLAHRPEIAQLIEQLTGPSTLTPDERDLLHTWPRLPIHVRAAVLRVLKELADAPPRRRT